MGVPVVGCDCSVCTSESPCNKRMRPSALVKIGEKRLLIDAGPDFRDQALRFGINHLDGVIFTHTHYDHIGGIDDLRVFNFRLNKSLPSLVSEVTYKDLEHRYYYLFHSPVHGSNVTASFDFQILKDERGVVTFEEVPLRYMSYMQGHMQVTGLRFGDLAYVSDIKIYSESIFEDLAGVKTLVVSALRHEPSYVHFNVEEAVAFAERVGATKTWFTHIGHELDHEKTNAELPPNIQLGYDGLELPFAP